MLLSWAALTPLIVWLASRIRLDGDRPRILPAAAHLITGVIISQAHLAIVGSLFFYFTRGATASSIPVLLRQWMQGFLILNLMTYGVVVGVFHAVSNARRYRARTLEAARLSAQTARLRQGLVEAKLHDPGRFVRVHKSSIVNLERIREVQPWFGGDYVAILHSGVQIRVSRTYSSRLLRTIQ